MKKILSILLLPVLALPARAEPVTEIHTRKDFCQAVLQGGAFNRYLEKTCGFKKGVSAKASRIISSECRGVFDKRRTSVLEKEAVDDGIMRFKRYGKADFCKANRQGYLDAGEVLDKISRARK